jgi:DNA polymerase III subunit delta
MDRVYQTGRKSAMKIETRAIPGFLKKPDPAIRAILLYGPDAGLVRERAEALGKTVVPDLSDPFRVADLAPETLKDDPARLADEAASISMMGGRRLIRLRGAGAESVTAIKNFLDDAKGDGLVVIEAGELDTKSALRKLFEAQGTKNGAALACYRDEGASLAKTIADQFLAEGVKPTGEAVEWLAGRLGSDRAITRSEISKLALYAGKGGTISLDEARGLIGDSADLDLDDLARATGLGDMGALDRAFAKLDGEGGSPVMILRALARHFLRLQTAAGHMANGLDSEAAMSKLFPPVFFKEKDAFKTQLARWNLAKIQAGLDRLLEAEIQCKSSGAAPADLIAERCLLALAQMAAQRAGR